MCAIPDRSGIYTSPMKFEYEAFVISGMWFAKKFYIARILDDERKIKLKQRGILLRRGDYPEIVKRSMVPHVLASWMDIPFRRLV